VSEPVRYTASKGLKGDLLASAKADAAPPTARKRALLVAAAAVATSTTATTATAGLGTLARIAAWKWVVVGAVGLGTVALGKAVVAPALAPQTPPALSHPRPSVPAPDPPPPERAPDPPPVAVAPSVPTSTPSPSSPADRNGPSRSVSPGTSVPAAAVTKEVLVPSPARPSTLAAEIASLDGAKQALAHADPAEALRQLDAYRSAFPSGRLAAEAMALRVEALVRAGRRDDARAELARLRAASPDSPLLENLTSVVGE
jgi:hypothetical protein